MTPCIEQQQNAMKMADGPVADVEWMECNKKTGDYSPRQCIEMICKYTLCEFLSLEMNPVVILH